MYTYEDGYDDGYDAGFEDGARRSANDDSTNRRGTSNMNNELRKIDIRALT